LPPARSTRFPYTTLFRSEAGHAVGSAVLVVAALLDVGHVVVGGGLAGAWDLLEPALLARLREAPPVSGHPVEVRRAALGGDATRSEEHTSELQSRENLVC